MVIVNIMILMGEYLLDWHAVKFSHNDSIYI